MKPMRRKGERHIGGIAQDFTVSQREQPSRGGMALHAINGATSIRDFGGKRPAELAFRERAPPLCEGSLWVRLPRTRVGPDDLREEHPVPFVSQQREFIYRS